MADNTIKVRLKQRYDKEANWKAKDPVLLAGEVAISSDKNGKQKVGDGTKKWSELSYSKADLTKEDVTTALGYTPPTTNTTYSDATQSAHGLMSVSDKVKLDGVETGANKTVVDSALSSTSTNPVQNKVINSALAGKSKTNHTHDLSTMINTLSTGTATPTDDDYYISQYSGGGTTTTTYHRRPMKALFEYIKSKLSTVAVSGSYNDLSNKPTIPAVGNGTVTIKQAGTSKGTFTMNQSGDTTIELTDNNSWRGIQDNLTSTSTTDSLSAAQGKVLNDKFASYVPTSRTVNGKSLSANISLTASDVGASTNGHTHNYAGSASAGGAANSANILNNYFGTTRQTSANIDLTNSTYANKVSYMMATSSMTTGKPPSDAHVLTFGWDTTAGWGAQLALGDGSGTHMYVRGADSKNNKSVYGNWKTMLDSDNYNSYAPSKTGVGASGTWGISVTGNAATATKLSSSAGSANQPVYFSDGKPVAGTYTIAKSVPSDAKFTDTVYTHPTYTAKTSGLYKVTVDSTGHVSATAAVTKADITGLGIPGTDTNTDTKVTQSAVKDSDYTNWRSLVWGSSNSATEGFTPTTVTDQLFSSTNLSVQPSTGTIKATTFKGSLNGTATNASKVNNHTVNSDVPSGAKFTDTVYTHPTTSGNKHIPSGGSSGQILRWSADGTAVWGADNNTTYNDATTSARGLMTAAMVTKLNGIATNANNYSLPTASSSTLGGVKTTSTVTDTSGYSPCPIVSGVPYYRNPLAQKEYTLSNITGTLAVNKGGTGATSASTGRANLGAVGFACQKTEPEDADQNVGDLWFAEE